MPKADIRNFTHTRIDRRFVEKVIGATLRHLAMGEDIYIEVAFVGRERIRKLNKQYAGKNEATDVLSFEAEKYLSNLEAHKHLGEVVVCPEVVKERAREAGTTFKRELSHVISHSTLHLLGYEHDGGKRQAERMHALEEEIMARVL